MKPLCAQRGAPWPLLASLAAATCLGALACQSPPSFSRLAIEDAALGPGLQHGFLLGTATAAHQIEGNNENDWTDWENGTWEDGNPRIARGERSGLATDSYRRFDEDLAAMKLLRANSYRFSVEWSRLEPEEGEWRDDVAAHYLSWATRLRAAGIEPMVTLHHFTLPRWVAARGGWANEETIGHFERFARRVGEALGAQVDLWCTLNEPNVQVIRGYLDGLWPPGVRDSQLAALAYAHLMRAHGRASRALRSSDLTDADGDGAATRIGLAHHVRIFQPATASSLDLAIADLTDDFFNEALPRAMATGRIQLSVPGQVAMDEPAPELEGATDYLGLNYYTRDFVRADLGSPTFSNLYVPRGRPTSDLGWDLYPEGLYLLLTRFAGFGWPLYVTENGIADAAGEARHHYLRAHVYAVQRATEAGVDVRGYFHWSLLDNFEWLDGFEPRFGLFTVDRSEGGSLRRSPTPAVESFRDIAARLPR